MLDYVSIDLFKSPAQTLVNTVNTVGVMGKGIAEEFRKRYPDMFRSYKRFCQAGELTVGKLYLYKGENKWVLNFPTKKHWRNPSKLEYIEAGLQKFVETYAAQGITSVSFPRLGTGNGGLDWEVVRPLMEQYLARVAIPVYIHSAAPPQGFVPEHLNRNKLRAFRSERMHISFEQFFSDIREHADAVENFPDTGDSEEPPPLAILRVDANRFYGEDFETLWGELMLRGALRVDEFPPRLAECSDKVIPMLLHLGYIEEMRFANQRDVGIRFAPVQETGVKQQPVVAHREKLG